MLYEVNGNRPIIHSSVYMQDGVKVEGNVIIGENVSLWYNAVLRGDIETITIGKNSNIQEQTSLHCDYGYPINIGENVTVAHGAIVHGATIGNNVLVGMGAIILNGAIIPDNCVVAAGSFVIPDSRFEENTMIVGSPAKAIRKLHDDEFMIIQEKTELYQDLKLKHKDVNNYKMIERENSDSYFE